MPAHATTVAEYCGILARSRLLPESEIAALRRQWEQEAPGADTDLERFRRFLVQKKLLTEYQAALIQRGHTEGFFIGGYTILDRIGKGRSAGVYKARHTSGQVVALKVLPASKARNPGTLGRFQREGRLLTQLDHPNVVRAFQVGQAGAVHFIVMEHLDGETLDEILVRRKKLPSPEAVRLVYQALRGLEHLHERRMVHRDLKPANLMVTPVPGPGQPDNTLLATVKILDVGIGRELFDDESLSTRDQAITGEGVILGTPDYIAPEQARDARSADIRADIYSLGCVLFHLIAGRPLFSDTTAMAVMIRHATETPPPLTTVTSAVPAGLQAVFDRLVAKRPEQRFATPAEAAEALRPFLPPDGASATAPPVLPAYQEWLATESSLELGDELKKLISEPPPTPALLAAPSPAKPIPPAAPPPAPPPAAPTRPTARPLPQAETEIDVELVTLPVLGDGEERSVFDLSRRDFVMLGIGATGVLAALGLGYGLAKLLKGVGEPPPAPEPPEGTPPPEEK